MLEKIKNLQWYYQLLLLVVIASLIYGVGVYYFFTSVTRAEVATTNAEVEKLEVQNNAARVATQRINEFRALYATKMVEYEELKVLLPEQREITNVLQGLQDNARDSKMIVMRFSPRDDTQQDVIMAKPVEIEVDSNFNNLRAFFDKMAKLPRIVSVSDFKLNQLDKQTAEKTVHAQFLLTAYYADPEMMNKPAPAAKGKKGKAAKDKAGAAGAPADPAKPAAK
jgi:type IV pilus assembly protein PilO